MWSFRLFPCTRRGVGICRGLTYVRVPHSPTFQAQIQHSKMKKVAVEFGSLASFPVANGLFHVVTIAFQRTRLRMS